jgi:hypothetical protein
MDRLADDIGAFVGLENMLTTNIFNFSNRL